MIGKGFIEKIEEGVAWGTFDTGKTFDAPVSPDHHHIGDEVHLYDNDDEEEAVGSSHTMLIMGKVFATVYWLNETDEGYQVVNTKTISNSRAN